MLWLAPWSASASGTAPATSSAWVTNGSGSQAASTWWRLRAVAMSGNGIALKRTAWVGLVIALSASTDSTSSVPMFPDTLTPIDLPCSWLTVWIGEPAGTTISWVPGCMIEPGAMICRLVGEFALCAASARM